MYEKQTAKIIPFRSIDIFENAVSAGTGNFLVDGPKETDVYKRQICPFSILSETLFTAFCFLKYLHRFCVCNIIDVYKRQGKHSDQLHILIMGDCALYASAQVSVS